MNEATDMHFRLPGRRVQVSRWVFGDRYIVQVDVEAVIDPEEPAEPCLEPATLRYLDEVQDWLDRGDTAKLRAAGVLFARQSA